MADFLSGRPGSEIILYMFIWVAETLEKRLGCEVLPFHNCRVRLNCLERVGTGHATISWKGYLVMTWLARLGVWGRNDSPGFEDPACKGIWRT
jgi:hypothetical protein